MVADVIDIAKAVAAPDVDTSEALVTASDRYPFRTTLFNFIRFASVIFGAGLLLRAGSSEQAVSAIAEDKPQPERPSKPRLALPQPAFGMVAESHATNRVGASASAATVDRDKAPHRLAAASSAMTGRDFAEQGRAPGKRMSRQGTGSSAGSASLLAMAAPAVPIEAGRLPSAAPEAVVPVKRDPVTRIAAVAPSAKTAPTSVLSTRNAAAGLLAPVKVVSRPTSEAAGLLSARSGKAASDRLAVGRGASSLSSAGALASAAMPVAAPKGVAGSTTSFAEHGPTIAPAGSGTSAISPGPTSVSPASVKISLAPPVMRPGPRTTVMTSDIRDVMRRPASAWDYAEGLPPELTGHSGSGQRSAEAAPVVQLSSAETQAAPRSRMAQGTAQDVRVQQAASAPLASSRVTRSAPAETSPVQASPVQASTFQASPVEASFVQASSARASVAPISPDAQTADHRGAPSHGAQAAAKPHAEVPIALLDRPSVAQPASPAPMAETKTAAIISPDRRIRVDHASASVRGKAEPVLPNAKDDFLVTAPVDSPDAGLRVSAAATPPHAETDGAQGPADSNGTERLADASGTDGSGLSLRERIPRPAF